MVGSARRRDVIAHVVRRIPASGGRGCPRVAVDGPDGSGKSIFADKLAVAVRALDRPAVRVSLDDFHNLQAVRYRQGRESPEGFWQDSFNYRRFHRDVLELPPPRDGVVAARAGVDLNGDGRPAAGR